MPDTAPSSGQDRVTTTAARKRRICKTTFILGAILAAAALAGSVLVGARAIVCTMGAFVGGTWMALILLAASKDSDLD